MYRIKVLVSVFFIAIIITWLIGCDDGNQSSIKGSTNTPTPRIINIFPADSASGVSTTASISIKFDMPMDTGSLMINFYLSSGSDMHTWMDSLDYYNIIGGMDDMNMADRNHMMEWMDSIQYSGHFNWNITRDSCEFIPEISFMPNTDYMFFINGNISNSDGIMMEMHHQNYNAHIYHFMTGN